MTAFSTLPIHDNDDDNDSDNDDGRRWVGVARVLGPRWSRLPSLTVGLFGVQMLWSVEMSYASPYLLSLGLSKSLMAIVFLAGPLSGLVVQPMIGILADNSLSRFGRRRPWLFACAVLCALATLLLGFTRPFASIFTTLNTPSNDTLTISLAVLAIYCIDFSINAVQALDRALLVDTIPTAKQPAGNAWAARMLAIGSVAGFFVGNLDLPSLFPFLGSVQLEVLSVFAALLLFFTHAWVCLHVKERILLSSSTAQKGFSQELSELWQTLTTLPRIIRQICWIQFFASLGWFPVLFYTTVYVGDLHKRSSPIPTSPAAALALDAESTRLGTRALLCNALVSLAANVIMPFFVVPHRTAPSPYSPRLQTWLDRVRIHLATMWALSHFFFALCMAATFVIYSVSGATLIVAVLGFCWAMAQWAPFALLGEAILSHPDSDDAGLISLQDTRSREDVERVGDHERELLFKAGEDDEGDEDEQESLNHHARRVSSCSGSRLSLENDENVSRIMEHKDARTSRADLAEMHGDGFGSIAGSSTAKRKRDRGLSAQAGAIIGIHNLFIVIPQFLVTGLSSLIFWLVDPAKSVVLHGQPHPDDANVGVGDATRRALWGRSDDAARGPDSIVIIFRLGGIAAAVAFILCYRLAQELKRR